MSLRSPLGRAQGLGSAGAGTEHWLGQRLSAVAMVPLTLIDSVIDKMKTQKLTVEQAAVELTKPCVCGVFNPTRAAELLRRFL